MSDVSPSKSHLCEDLAIVDANLAADHLGQDDHVPQVGLHHLGLLPGHRLPLHLPELLDEGEGLPLQAPGQLPPGPGRQYGGQLGQGQVQGRALHSGQLGTDW